MAVVQRGMVRDHRIVLAEPIDLPEETEVVVTIEPVPPAVASELAAHGGGEAVAATFFGLWRDREDMADSVAWLRKARTQWQQRLVHRA